MDKIELNNVVKIFGDSPEKALDLFYQGVSFPEIYQQTGHVVAVGGVSFSVAEGETVVVMGLSGSGKSTLVRCINRLFEPTAGEIYVDGQEVQKLDSTELRDFRRQKFGMVFQHFALFPHRTVLDNVEFGLEVQGEEKSKRQEKAENALTMVGLKGWGDKYPGELSGGMQQRVGLARALCLDPDILLMDEAFSALDPLIRRDMQDELIKLQQSVKKTIVFISHDLDEALKIGDRLVILKDAQVDQIGTPEEILTKPATEYVRKFVEDVDITKVLTAESVMKKCEDVAYIGSDGPNTALRKMRKNAIASLFVLNRDLSVAGIVFAEDVRKLVDAGGTDLEQVLHTDIPKVHPDTLAHELFPIMQSISYPVAVVDQENKFLGVIVKGRLFTAIAERGGEV